MTRHQTKQIISLLVFIYKRISCLKKFPIKESIPKFTFTRINRIFQILFFSSSFSPDTQNMNTNEFDFCFVIGSFIQECCNIYSCKYLKNVKNTLISL